MIQKMKKGKKNSKIKVVVAIVPKRMMVPCFQVVSAGSLNNPRVIFYIKNYNERRKDIIGRWKQLLVESSFQIQE